MSEKYDAESSNKATSSPEQIIKEKDYEIELLTQAVEAAFQWFGANSKGIRSLEVFDFCKKAIDYQNKIRG